MQYFSYFATVIRDDGLRRVIITVFTVSWSVSIVSDAVFFDLGSKESANKQWNTTRLASSNATLEKAVKSQSELIETIQKKLCALESTLQNQGNLTSDDSNSPPLVKRNGR